MVCFSARCSFDGTPATSIGLKVFPVLFTCMIEKFSVCFVKYNDWFCTSESFQGSNSLQKEKFGIRHQSMTILQCNMLLCKWWGQNHVCLILPSKIRLHKLFGTIYMKLSPKKRAAQNATVTEVMPRCNAPSRRAGYGRVTWSHCSAYRNLKEKTGDFMGAAAE